MWDGHTGRGRVYQLTKVVTYLYLYLSIGGALGHRSMRGSPCHQNPLHKHFKPSQSEAIVLTKRLETIVVLDVGYPDLQWVNLVYVQ